MYLHVMEHVQQIVLVIVHLPAKTHVVMIAQEAAKGNALRPVQIVALVIVQANVPELVQIAVQAIVQANVQQLVQMLARLRPHNTARIVLVTVHLDALPPALMHVKLKLRKVVLTVPPIAVVGVAAVASRTVLATVEWVVQ